MKIEFRTTTDAFDQFADKEVRRILENIADEIERGFSENRILDLNGVIIGHYKL